MGGWRSSSAVAASLVAAALIGVGCGGVRRVGQAGPEPVASAAAPAGMGTGGAAGSAGVPAAPAAAAAPVAAPRVVAASPAVAAPASGGPVAPGTETGPVSGISAGSPTGSLPAPTPGSSPAAAPLAASAPPASISLEAVLRLAMVDAAKTAARRQQFAHAVAKISAQLGAPISAEQALRDMPCGGWSGPECSNLTLGLEMVRACAPIVASFHGKRTAEIAAVLAEAVAIHAVWHDAFGYVRRIKKKGPGYTYAGCLFSRCDPNDLKSGQVDGVVYQVGRLLGTVTGPACGPECTLGDL
ncbi:MAG TPA: hypothetical protein VKB80_07800 [Kofleriaceae bacterium]|nr:hypothetical protein [Kofleriaceae bacterium]